MHVGGIIIYPSLQVGAQLHSPQCKLGYKHTALNACWGTNIQYVKQSLAYIFFAKFYSTTVLNFTKLYTRQLVHQ